MEAYVDLIGYFALLLNLHSMAARKERRLRMISLVANGIYIYYGILIGALPIILGCATAVLLHAYRLKGTKTVSYEGNKNS